MLLDSVTSDRLILQSFTGFYSLLDALLVFRKCLVRSGLPEADPETRICMEVIYKGMLPEETYTEWWKCQRGGCQARCDLRGSCLPDTAGEPVLQYLFQLTAKRA